MAHIDQRVRFTRGDLTHEARRMEIFEDGRKPVALLTNNFDLPKKDVAEAYRLRWTIESLCKQLKQNFPLHFTSSTARASTPYMSRRGLC